MKMKKYKAVITDTAPLSPPLWGGPKRIWNLYCSFPDAEFDMTYVGVKPAINNGLRYSYARAARNIDEYDCAYPFHYKFWRRVETALMGRTSLDLFSYLAPATIPQFRELLDREDADIFICSHPWSAPAVKKRKRQLFVYDAHNCEYSLMRQILEGSPFAGPVCAWVKSIEAQACRKSDLIVACSEKDREDLISYYGQDREKIMLAPNGAKAGLSVTAREKSSARVSLGLPGSGVILLFIGAYYKPNIDAAGFIVRRLAPSMPDALFIIAGSVKEYFRSMAVPHNVRFLGQLDDEYLSYSLLAADAAVNPMFDGSGVNIKMLDYMAYGLPVVTTDCGARGIEPAERRPYIISDEANFSDDLNALVNDAVRMSEMSSAGQDLVARKYDWSRISSSVESRIKELLESR